MFSSLFTKFLPHLRGRRCFYQVAILLVTSCRAISQIVIAKLPPFWLSQRPLDEAAAEFGKSPLCRRRVCQVAVLFLKSSHVTKFTILFVKRPFCFDTSPPWLSSRCRVCQLAALFVKSPCLCGACVSAFCPCSEQREDDWQGG